MKSKNILIINGHPNPESFISALAESYSEGAKENFNKVSLLNLSALNFNINLKYGYQKRTELEPDLLDAIKKIKTADHIVWLFPTWWYGYPALMKGFIDRTFLPGIMFDFEPGKTMQKKLLKGKSAHIIVTADTPLWYNKLVMKNPAVNQLKKGTLQFCGISPVKVSYIAPIKNSSDTYRKKWLSKIRSYGTLGK